MTDGTRKGWSLPKLPKLARPRLGVPDIRVPAILGDASARIGEALSSGTDAALDAVRGTVDSGFGVLRGALGGLPLLGLNATSDTYDGSAVDEKHYFLLPDETAEFGHALLILRCLPDGVPPVNDLAKRRLLHLPDRDALPMLRHLVMQDAREQVSGDGAGRSLPASIDALADEIDAVDHKVFGGALAIGGLVALVNPLAGAAIAANAMVPSVGLIVAKYGLRTASQSLTNMDMAREIRRAEKDVVRQFKSADTVALVNPVLGGAHSQGALDMWMMEPERFVFDADGTTFGPADTRRFCALTLEALTRSGARDDVLAHAEQVAEIAGGAKAG